MLQLEDENQLAEKKSCSSLAFDVESIDTSHIKEQDVSRIKPCHESCKEEQSIHNHVQERERGRRCLHAFPLDTELLVMVCLKLFSTQLPIAASVHYRDLVVVRICNLHMLRIEACHLCTLAKQISEPTSRAVSM